MIGKHVYIDGKYYGQVIDVTDNLVFVQKNDDEIPNAFLKSSLEKLNVEISDEYKPLVIDGKRVTAKEYFEHVNNAIDNMTDEELFSLMQEVVKPKRKKGRGN